MKFHSVTEQFLKFGSVGVIGTAAHYVVLVVLCVFALGAYYLAYHRLGQHWREALGERLVEIDYEALVSDQEAQTRLLLDALGLRFEEACLNFEQNRAASNTASSVQIREKAHTRSVNRWKKYEKQLQPLRNCLEAGGVEVE